MNSFYGYKGIHRWTFHSNLGYKRRLDYIFCEGFIRRFSNNCRVYNSVSDGFDSDHRVVVMDCSFPSKRQRKLIFYPRKSILSPNIKNLWRDENVANIYSDVLDQSMESFETLTNVDDLSDKITKSVQMASDSTIPRRQKSSDHKPWVDASFLQLIDRRNSCKNKQERCSLNKLRSIGIRLKMSIFVKKAEAINTASESREIEEEFRLARDHSSLNKSKRLLIDPSKLKDHFAKHFDVRNVQCQPEIENPDLFPIFYHQMI